MDQSPILGRFEFEQQVKFLVSLRQIKEPGCSRALSCPVDDREYDENIRRIDAVLRDSELRVARQRELVERVKETGGLLEDAQQTLDLMLELIRTMRQIRNAYVTLFRGLLH